MFELGSFMVGLGVGALLAFCAAVIDVRRMRRG